MNNKIWLASFLLLAIALSTLQGVSAINISACQTINSPGTYTLNQSIISTANATCLDIQSNGVIIDCAGYSMTGSNFTGTLEIGIELTAQSDISISNCNIKYFNTGISTPYGSDNTSVYNTSVTGFGGLNSGGGIRINTNSIIDNVTVISKNIFAPNIIGVRLGIGTNLSNSIISLNNTVNSSWAVNLRGSNNVYNNTITSINKSFIFSSLLTGSIIYNNTINGLYLEESFGGSNYSFNTTIGNTWINSLGTGFSETCTNDGSGVCVEDYVLLTGTDFEPIALTPVPNMVVTSLSPANNTPIVPATTLDFNVDAFGGLNNTCIASIDGSPTSANASVNAGTNGSIDVSSQLTPLMDDGLDHNWSVSCTDDAVPANTGTSETRLFSVRDPWGIYECSVISSSGTYVLKNNITGDSGNYSVCLSIEASAVTINAENYSITSNGSAVYSIYLPSSIANNFKINNGYLLGSTGIYFGNSITGVSVFGTKIISSNKGLEAAFGKAVNSISLSNVFIQASTAIKIDRSNVFNLVNSTVFGYITSCPSCFSSGSGLGGFTDANISNNYLEGAINVGRGSGNLYNNIINVSGTGLGITAPYAINLNLSTAGNTWTNPAQTGYSDTCAPDGYGVCETPLTIGTSTDYYSVALTPAFLVSFLANDIYNIQPLNTFCVYDSSNSSAQWCTVNGNVTKALVAGTYNFTLNESGFYAVEESSVLPSTINYNIYPSITQTNGGGCEWAQSFTVTNGSFLYSIPNAGTFNFTIYEGQTVVGPSYATRLSNVDLMNNPIPVTVGQQYTVHFGNRNMGMVLTDQYSGGQAYCGGWQSTWDMGLSGIHTYEVPTITNVLFDTKQEITVGNVLVEGVTNPSAVWDQQTSTVRVNFSNNGVDTTTEVDYGVGTVIVYNQSYADISTNNLVVGENTFTVTMNETFSGLQSQASATSNPLNVSKLNNLSNIQPSSGTISTIVWNSTWNAATNGLGIPTYDSILEVNGVNYTQGIAGSNVFTQVNQTFEGPAYMYVRANDDYFTTNYVQAGAFDVAFNIAVTSDVCAALTYPNEKDLPAQAIIPVNFTVDYPLGLTTPAVGVDVTFGGNTYSANGCTETVITPTQSSFACTVPMKYFYAPGDYDMNITVTDDGKTTSAVTSGVCTYGQLIASERTTLAIGFPTGAPGVANAPGDVPVNILNTGNVPLNLFMTAVDLSGRSSPGNTLAATTFKLGESVGTATQMQHNVQKDLSMIITPGDGASQNILFWLSMPQNQIIQDYYSATPWSVVATG